MKGTINNILIDSGTTSNILDPQATRRLNVGIEDTRPLLVSVANGFKVKSTQLHKQFKWSAQGQKFSNEMRILSLGGVDAVFRVQWLKLLGPITIDFSTL